MKLTSLLLFVIILLFVPGAIFAGGEQEEMMDDGQEMMMNDGKRVLQISTNTSDPAPKALFEQAVAMFNEENPDIDAQLTIFDHEAYKTNIRNFLVAEPPDVATWFAGNRMKFFVDQGLFEDVSDVWNENNLDRDMASSYSALSVDGNQYGVPYAYYQWGVYYRSDLFEQVGASVPTTWEEFLEACSQLSAAGITPISIGTKFLWTAAGWFDYLNLRVNGLDFHLGLADGDISYLDPRLDQVFEYWQELLDAGYFLENHATYSWQEAQAPVIQGTAAMYLIGNFIVPFFEDAGIVDNIGFFPFPVINPNAGSYEDAPTDTIHIPSGAKNKEDAKKFLAFIARPDINNMIATGIGNLPPNNKAPAPSDRFLQAGATLLAASDGLAQFYDRDTDPEMAQIGMEGFQEFMTNPDRLSQIRQRLDDERKRIFGN